MSRMSIPLRECRCPGHYNALSKSCMVQPGAHGPSCTKLSAFDTPGTTLSIANVSAKLPRSYPYSRYSAELGSRGLFCTGIHDIMQETKRYMSNWVRDRNRLLLARRTSHRCFGCSPTRQVPSASPNLIGAHTGCCGGHGECIHGWCACHSGHFGPDCMHQAEGAHAVIRGVDRPRLGAKDGIPLPAVRNGISIFVYELPPDVAFNFGRSIDPNYRAEWAFIDRLLSDWDVRTLDPEAADLFVVPFLGVFGATSNRMCDRARFELVVHWLRSVHPYYDRTQGRDHVFFLPGDRGACGIGATGPILVRRMRFARQCVRAARSSCTATIRLISFPFCPC